MRLSVTCSRYELAALALGCLVLSVLATRDDPQALLVCAAVFGIMSASALWALYELQFVAIGFSREGIFRKSPGRETPVPWSDVVAIDFSESMQWFRFRTRARDTIRVSVYRTGLGTLAEIADGSPLPKSARDGIRMLREKAARHAWER